MNQLITESSLGIITVLIAGITVSQFSSSETIQFGLPLIIGFIWSAGLLYRHADRERDST